MKKTCALLLLLCIAFSAAHSSAQDLSSLTIEELTDLQERVASEISSRNTGITAIHFIDSEVGLDSLGAKCLILTFEWTNTDTASKAFGWTYGIEALQDDALCEMGFVVGTDHDMFSDVKGGASQIVKIAFVLRNESSPVGVVISDSIFDKSSVAFNQIFEISATADKSEDSEVVVVDHALAQSGHYIVILENQTSRQIPDVALQVLFLDKSGNVIATEKDGHDAVLPRSRIASRVSTHMKPGEYDSVEFILETSSSYGDYVNHAEQLTINCNEGKNGIIATVLNNAGETVEELEIVAVYYKEGKIVGASEEERRDIKNGKSEIIEFSYPRDKNYKPLEYDDYILFINQAHVF